MNDEMFIDNCIGEKKRVTIFLSNGVGLVGIIKSHSESSIILRHAGVDQLIYKKQIATIMPS